MGCASSTPIVEAGDAVVAAGRPGAAPVGNAVAAPAPARAADVAASPRASKRLTADGRALSRAADAGHSPSAFKRVGSSSNLFGGGSSGNAAAGIAPYHPHQRTLPELPSAVTLAAAFNDIAYFKSVFALVERAAKAREAAAALAASHAPAPASAVVASGSGSAHHLPSAHPRIREIARGGFGEPAIAGAAHLPPPHPPPAAAASSPPDSAPSPDVTDASVAAAAGPPVTRRTPPHNLPPIHVPTSSGAGAGGEAAVAATPAGLAGVPGGTVGGVELYTPNPAASGSNSGSGATPVPTTTPAGGEAGAAAVTSAAPKTQLASNGGGGGTPPHHHAPAAITVRTLATYVDKRVHGDDVLQVRARASGGRNCVRQAAFQCVCVYVVLAARVRPATAAVCVRV